MTTINPSISCRPLGAGSCVSPTSTSLAGIRAAGTQTPPPGAAPTVDTVRLSQPPAPSPGASTACPAGSSGAAVGDAIRRRQGRAGLREAIMGALVYLDDTQIRDRPGRGSSAVDACRGNGCRSTAQVNPPFLGSPFEITTVGYGMKNYPGEWASYVHFLPGRTGLGSGLAPVAVQDSNMFVTTAVAYPLFLFDESALPDGGRVVTQMRRQAVDSVREYRRGDAYNFWHESPGRQGTTRTGPPNIPVGLIEGMGRSYLNPWHAPFWDHLGRGLDVVPRDWMRRALDERENPTGGEALFNIPDDADDTAMAVAIEALHARTRQPGSSDPYERDPSHYQVDLPSLGKLERFRDVGRKREDPREAWKAPGTGAYLTWLKDEEQPVFGDPNTGVIPLDVNNVDTVVNANAVFSLALNGQTGTAGYRAATDLLARVIRDRTWEKGALYYPQRMIFPYSASRAYRDGGAQGPVMRDAMKDLLGQVLDLQAEVAREHPEMRGAFPGGEDHTWDLSTALGVNCLLNVGRDLAVEIGREGEYDRALNEGIGFLLKRARPVEVKHEDTFNRKLAPQDRRQGRVWEDGLFFSASYHDFAHWRSAPYTTAVALEALTKYQLAYDLGGVDMQGGRRMQVQRYAAGADVASSGFVYGVK